jgi:hypothetical protein
MKLSLIKKFNDLHYANTSENEFWKQVDDILTNPKDLIDSVDWFISNLGPNHDLLGRDWNKLVGIGEWAREYHSFTRTQARFVTITISANINEIIQLQEFQFI